MITKIERKVIGEIQDKVGFAKSIIWDDIDQNSKQKATEALDKAFELLIELLSKYPPSG